MLIFCQIKSFHIAECTVYIFMNFFFHYKSPYEDLKFLTCISFCLWRSGNSLTTIPHSFISIISNTSVSKTKLSFIKAWIQTFWKHPHCLGHLVRYLSCSNFLQFYRYVINLCLFAYYCMELVKTYLHIYDKSLDLSV